MKSIGSAFRTYEAAIDLGDGLDASHTITIESAADVLEQLHPLIERAAAKTLTVPADGRHALMIVHPFEHLALETLETMVAAILEDPHLPDGLDSLWVLWFPEQLTIWSRRLQGWTQVLLDAHLGDDTPHEPDDGRGPLERAEELLLAPLPGAPSSPFQYRIDFES